MKVKVAVYPGTFDPITNGHLDILARAEKIFDRIIIGVAEQHNKDTLFDLEERVEMVCKVVSERPGVTVESFSGLLVNYVRKKKACTIVRGLRAVSDFEYEYQMYLTNKKLNENIETIFLMSSSEYAFISSSIIKQLVSLGGCVKGLVPPEVEMALFEKYRFPEMWGKF